MPGSHLLPERPEIDNGTAIGAGWCFASPAMSPPFTAPEQMNRPFPFQPMNIPAPAYKLKLECHPNSVEVCCIKYVETAGMRMGGYAWIAYKLRPIAGEAGI
jgi:hypothetical protein